MKQLRRNLFLILLPLILFATACDTKTVKSEWTLKDLSERPQLWFGPLDPWSWDRYFPGKGSFQFYDLFSDNAAWQQSAEAVHVMHLYPAWLDGYASKKELKDVFDNLRQRKMAVSYETGPLTERGPCNASTIEGFNGKVANVLNNMQSAAGVLHRFNLEHGFDAATYYDERCRMTPKEIAQDVAKTIQAVRSVFPEVKIGSIETADLNVNDVAAWLTAYKEVMGEELSFFHLDIAYYRPDWAERAREIEAYVKSRGVDFGIIYFGDAEDTSDLEWLTRAESRFVEYEVFNAGQPDHVIFQSWHPHPQKLLPESDKDSFTHLILRYLRTRTRLSLELSEQAASGRLTMSEATPIPNASLEITVTPVSGDGIYADYTLTGEVPQTATKADVGLRINTECDCSGQAILALTNISFSESGSVNKVVNGDFSKGLNSWGIWGDGSFSISSGENSSDSALAIQVKQNQFLGMNSESFGVSPETSFTINFRAKIAPLSKGSGYFDVIFQSSEGEVRRLTIPLDAASVVIGTASTDTSGNYTVDRKRLPQGDLELKAWFAGDDMYWPAISRLKLAP